MRKSVKAAMRVVKKVVDQETVETFSEEFREELTKTAEGMIDYLTGDATDNTKLNEKIQGTMVMLNEADPRLPTIHDVDESSSTGHLLIDRLLMGNPKAAEVSDQLTSSEQNADQIVESSATEPKVGPSSSPQADANRKQSLHISSSDSPAVQFDSASPKNSSEDLTTRKNSSSLTKLTTRRSATSSKHSAIESRESLPRESTSRESSSSLAEQNRERLTHAGSADARQSLTRQSSYQERQSSAGLISRESTSSLAQPTNQRSAISSKHSASESLSRQEYSHHSIRSPDELQPSTSRQSLSDQHPSNSEEPEKIESPQPDPKESESPTALSPVDSLIDADSSAERVSNSAEPRKESSTRLETPPPRQTYDGQGWTDSQQLQPNPSEEAVSPLAEYNELRRSISRERRSSTDQSEGRERRSRSSRTSRRASSVDQNSKHSIRSSQPQDVQPPVSSSSHSTTKSNKSELSTASRQSKEIPAKDDIKDNDENRQSRRSSRRESGKFDLIKTFGHKF